MPTIQQAIELQERLTQEKIPNLGVIKGKDSLVISFPDGTTNAQKSKANNLLQQISTPSLEAIKAKLLSLNNEQANSRVNQLALNRSGKEIATYTAKKQEALAYNASNTTPSARNLSVAPFLAAESRSKFKALNNGVLPSDAQVRPILQEMVDFIVNQAAPSYESAMGKILAVRSAIEDQVNNLQSVNSAQSFDIESRWKQLLAIA